MGIPQGIEGTRRTLRLMRALVHAGKKSSLVRQLTVQLTQYLPQKSWIREVETLHAFVRDKIRYVRDIRKIETLQIAERTLQNRGGDCDDKSVLLAAMLESIGHPTRFIAIGFRPDSCDHVYVEVRPGGKGNWLALETTEPVNAGWSALRTTSAKKTLIMEN